MATRYAVATGNWSSVATWDGGTTLPTASDDVYADGKTVTIDQDVTVLSLRTTARSGGTAGGGFTLPTARNVDCSAGIGFSAGTSTCLTISATTGTSNIKGASGASTNVHGINVTGAGTVNFTGTLGGYGSGGYAALNIGAPGNVAITGNLTGLANSAVIIAAAATVTIVGNITTTSSGAGLAVNAAAVVTITGNVTTAGSTAGITAGNASSTITVVGTLTGNTYVAAYSTAAAPTLIASGPFISSGTGIQPFTWAGPVKLTGMTGNEFRFAKSTGGTFSLWSSDVNSGSPTAANVRKGTTFGVSNEFAGTMTIPAAADVVSGVPVDVSSVGTAAVSGQSWL